MEPLSLQEYICSLDPTTLPRILRICSGVYFQGSVYEISGNECCLSTGDLLKVTAVALQKVICEDVGTGQTTELPPTFKGERGCPAPSRTPGPAPSGPVPEGGRDRGLTLQQALGKGQSQPVLCRDLGPRALILRPVYEVHAAMDLRRDVVKIPSTLEVDVEDVTAEAQHARFSQPLLLSEVLAMAHVLPVQAEILEGPAGPAVFQSSWVPRLRQGQRLQLHGCSGAWRVLASAPGRRRHFLLASTYRGQLRMRPRQFTGVQELAAAVCPGRALRVVVTQDCEGRGLHVPPLSVGDRLEAMGLQGHGPGTRLRCHRHSGDEEEEEEGEELLLPLDLGGSFVEEARGSRRYGLEELLERRALPCDVRVVAPDPALAGDALGTLPALRLEVRLHLPVLVGSFCEEPEQGFEVPPRWMDCSVLLRQGPVRPAPHCAPVQELTEDFYYRLLAQLPRSEAPPPPRPPKPVQAGMAPRGNPPSSAPQSPGPALMGACAAPPVLPQRSASSLCGQRGCPGDADPGSDSSEHDYETIDDAIQKPVHKMQAIFPF
ncbi:protein THEMIS2 [Pezoporus wallicus]|uniref:protein THEMIS2 n=1 Tax=Pezoporus wallicus TaxID=35540 RepID=UPI00254CCF71|nr:protein THEMIS2 [Pezoporus wallicus]